MSRKSEQEWVKELADKESEYGTQLGAMTQKNAQMRVELKQCEAGSKEERGAGAVDEACGPGRAGPGARLPLRSGGSVGGEGGVHARVGLRELRRGTWAESRSAILLAGADCSNS